MSVKDDVARLTPLPAAGPRLKPARAPRAIRAQTGLQRRAVASVDSASEEITVESSDGLFTFIVRVVKG